MVFDDATSFARHYSRATAKEYLKEEETEQDDMNVFNENVFTDSAGVAHKVVERNDIVGDFKAGTCTSTQRLNVMKPHTLFVFCALYPSEPEGYME